eukprot:TRINITY_DN10217_c0_g1_i1.p2 TRINITY_DN10217_c0_g1~~TRINITY_DN10217_c0_g1_i1.p2  ORF type:complete len:116 (+),score=21.01 TRINITY_DN10217_c0_g1_i1:63-410(+)
MCIRDRSNIILTVGISNVLVGLVMHFIYREKRVDRSSIEFSSPLEVLKFFKGFLTNRYFLTLSLYLLFGRRGIQALAHDFSVYLQRNGFLLEHLSIWYSTYNYLAMGATSSLVHS